MHRLRLTLNKPTPSLHVASLNLPTPVGPYTGRSYGRHEALSIQHCSSFEFLRSLALTRRLFIQLFLNNPHLNVQFRSYSERILVSVTSPKRLVESPFTLTFIFLHCSPIAKILSPHLWNVIPLDQSRAALYLREYPKLERPIILGEVVVIVQSTEV